MKVIYYYQTLADLTPVLNNSAYVDRLIVSAIHFGQNADGSPYIHLNNYPPDHPINDQMWKDTIDANKLGIEIHIMVGGAGHAYQRLFSDFETYYALLKQTIETRPWITGIDLDVEEFVSLAEIQRLIEQIRMDFKTLAITMAPIQEELQYDQIGIGGFIYKDLYNSSAGAEISEFNVQAYYDYSVEAFESIIKNGYPAKQLIFGMLDYQFDETTIQQAITTIHTLYEKYPDFAGVDVWEYFDAPPDPDNPIKWAELMKSASNQNDKSNQ